MLRTPCHIGMYTVNGNKRPDHEMYQHKQMCQRDFLPKREISTPKCAEGTYIR